MSTFTIPEQTLPSKKYDVVIVGGGTTGVFAAIAAARTGAKTALVEAKGYLGGTAVEAVTALHSFFNNWKYFNKEKVQLVRGIPSELVDRVYARGGCTGHAEMVSNYAYESVCTAVDSEIYKLVAHEMCVESGVDVMVNTRMASTVCENGTVKTIIVATHSGDLAIRAKAYVDCTGYGDLCAEAGAEFTEPNDHMAAAPVGIAGVDIDKFVEFFKSRGALSDLAIGHRDDGEDMIVRANGRESCLPKEFVDEMKATCMNLIVTTVHKDYFMFLKFNIKLPTTVTKTDEASAAELTLRQYQARGVALLRKYIPGCENAYIARTPASICVRRARCITCDSDMTNEEITSGAHHEDDVFEYGFHDESPRFTIAEGGCYGFPYRAMLPKGLNNVYATGMMITSNFHAHMSTRNTVSCMAQGQAAGTAAAMCAAKGIDIRALDMAELHQALLDGGVYFTK